MRLTVLVFTPGNPNSQDRYSIDEGDFQDIKIDRRLDIKPFQVSYLAYDFCRFNPSNGVVEVCEERYRIGRPADGHAHADADAHPGRADAAARSPRRRRR